MSTLLKLAALTAVFLPLTVLLSFLFLRSQQPFSLDPELHTGPLHPPTLVEYGDFRCPYCAKFATLALPALEQDFLASGNLTYEYHHFPILGPESFAAAEASECARDQARFDDYHDVLFDIALSPHSDIQLNPANLIQLSHLMGMDSDQFRSCVMTRAHKPTVQAQADKARSLGAMATPSLFIDGNPLPWKDYPRPQEQDHPLPPSPFPTP